MEILNLKSTLKTLNTVILSLFEAIDASSPELFADYITWERIFLVNLGIPETRLKERLEVMEDVIVGYLPPEKSSIAVKYIRREH